MDVEAEVEEETDVENSLMKIQRSKVKSLKECNK